jgi:Mg/Co/Ni transporter MgtE
MNHIKNQSALTWYTDDVRNAVECLSANKQDKFYAIVGESEEDLYTFLESVFEERSDVIIQFINEQIADAVTNTLDYEDD